MQNTVVRKMISATTGGRYGGVRDVYLNPMYIMRVYANSEGAGIYFVDGSHEQVRETAAEIAGAFEIAMNGLKEDGE